MFDTITNFNEFFEKARTYHVTLKVTLLFVLAPLTYLGWEGGGDKKSPFPPTSFPPVTSTNKKINLKNFLTFSFNSFATLV